MKLFCLSMLIGIIITGSLRFSSPSIAIILQRRRLKTHIMFCCDCKVVVHIFPDQLRGMTACEAIDSSTPIMIVRSTNVIEVTNDRQPNPYPMLISENVWRKAQWYKRIAFKLLVERTSSNRKRRFGWIDELPNHFDTPIHWTSQELIELQYEALIENVRRQNIEWRTFYDEWQSESHPGCLRIQL